MLLLSGSLLKRVPEPVPGYTPTGASVAHFASISDSPRILIVGTGPSLSAVALGTAAAYDHVFCLNRSYIAVPPGDKNHVFIGDPAFIGTYQDELVALEGFGFVVSRPVYQLFHPDGAFVFDRYLSPNVYQGAFQKSLGSPLFTAHSILFPALQVAYCLGSRNIDIVGIDLNFADKKNHFYNSAESEELRRNHTSVMHQQMMRKAFAYSVFYMKLFGGVSIRDLNPDGNLPGLDYD